MNKENALFGPSPLLGKTAFYLNFLFLVCSAFTAFTLLRLTEPSAHFYIHLGNFSYSAIHGLAFVYSYKSATTLKSLMLLITPQFFAPLLGVALPIYLYFVSLLPEPSFLGHMCSCIPQDGWCALTPKPTQASMPCIQSYIFPKN